MKHALVFLSFLIFLISNAFCEEDSEGRLIREVTKDSTGNEVEVYHSQVPITIKGCFDSDTTISIDSYNLTIESGYTRLNSYQPGNNPKCLNYLEEKKIETEKEDKGYTFFNSLEAEETVLYPTTIEVGNIGHSVLPSDKEHWKKSKMQDVLLTAFNYEIKNPIPKYRWIGTFNLNELKINVNNDDPAGPKIENIQVLKGTKKYNKTDRNKFTVINENTGTIEYEIQFDFLYLEGSNPANP